MLSPESQAEILTLYFTDKWSIRAIATKLGCNRLTVKRVVKRRSIQSRSDVKRDRSSILDPYKETGDINEGNNTWNIKAAPTKYDMYKAKSAGGRGQSNGWNPMKGKK